MKKKVAYITIWIVISIVLLYLTIYLCKNNAFDTDLFWHLKIGKDILSSKEIFLENTYTWIQGTLWTQQEWLFDVILYAIVSAFGIVGFYALHFITQCSVIYGSIKHNQYHFDFIVVCFLILLYYHIPLNAPNRPAEFSTLIFILMFYLYNKQYKLKPLIYFLCGIFIANFHCGAAVALTVLMVMMFAIEIVLDVIFKIIKDIPFKLTRRFSIQYIVSIILYILGLCINPYGFKQVRDMFCVMHLETTQNINEWQSFNSPSYVTWILLFFIAYSFGYAIKAHVWDKTETRTILVLSAFFVLSCVSRKAFIMFYYLFAAYGIKYVDEMIYDFFINIGLTKDFVSAKADVDMPDKLPYKNTMCRILFVFGILVCTVSCIKGNTMESFIDDAEIAYIDDDAVNYLKSIPEDDFRILNGYVAGNCLLYNDIKCFIDTRQFPYSKEFGWSTALDDAFNTDKKDIEEMDALFDKYDFNYVLSSEKSDFKWYLEQNLDEWEICYTNNIDNIYIWRKIGH